MPRPGRSLAEVRPEMVALWDAKRNGGLTPADVSAGSAKRAWFACPKCGQIRETEIRGAHRAGHCLSCAARKREANDPKRIPSLAGARPELAAQWDAERNANLTPADVGPKSGRIAWFICAGCGTSRELQIDSAGVRCSACANDARLTDPGRSLASVRPELAAQWDTERNANLTPADVRPKSKRIAWFICAGCGTSRELQIDSAGVRCSACTNGARLTDPDRSLARVRPEVADQWDTERNGELTPDDVRPFPSVRAWFICASCGVSRELQIGGARARCRACANGARLTDPGRSLASVRPEVAAQWDTERNGGLTPADVGPKSKRIAWFICAGCGTSRELQIDTARARCRVCWRSHRG